MLRGYVGHQRNIGPAYPVTAAWRRLVLRRLEELGWSQAELARRIGCAAPTITNVMRDSSQSRLVPAIHKALGWDAPALPADAAGDPSSNRVAELVEIYENLPEDIRALALDQVRALAAAMRKNRS